MTSWLVINGSGGNDFLSGTAGNDQIHGHGGHDWLFGDSGSDYIDGGYGNDYIDGGYGHDTLIGGYGDDILYGGSGSDLLFGDSGADTLVGGYGTDSLLGGYGPDRLNGVEFNSNYTAPNDVDYLYGGVDTHQDLFYLGTDRAFYTGSGFAVIGEFNVNYDKLVIGNNTDLSRYSLGTGNLAGSSAIDTLIRLDGDIVGVIQDQNLSGYNSMGGKDFMMDYYWQVG